MKIKRSPLINLIVCVLLTYPAVSISQLIEVEVLDAQNQEPISYAHLYLKNNGLVGITDRNGKVKWSGIKFINLNDTLICSFVGYQTIEKPLTLGKNQKIKLTLSYLELEEVIVSETASNETAVDIVKSALKQIKKKYVTSSFNQTGYYRETFWRDNKANHLNESFFKTYSTKYPQKNYVRKSFRDYYSHFTATGSASWPFRNPQFFKYYNTVEDQCLLISSRMTIPQITPHQKNAEGGPSALLAADKVKYLADFLDKKLIKKYEYRKKPARKYMGRDCFVISFTPKISDIWIHQGWNKKIKYALFAGQIFIDINERVVVGYECQFSDNPNFGNYENRGTGIVFPKLVEIKVEYQPTNSIWSLSNVSIVQEIYNKVDGKMALDKCERYLQVLDVNHDDIQVFDEADRRLLRDRAISAYIDHIDRYDEYAWNELENKYPYKKPSSEIIQALSDSMTLQEQYSSWFEKLDLSIPTHTLKITKDNFNDSIAQKAVASEAKYYNNWFIDKKLKRRLGLEKITGYYPKCYLPDTKPRFEMIEIDSLTGERMVRIKTKTGIVRINKKRLISKGESLLGFTKYNSDSSKVCMLRYKYADHSQTAMIYDLKSEKVISIFPQFSDVKWINETHFAMLQSDAYDFTDRLSIYKTGSDAAKLILSHQRISPAHELEFDHKATDSTSIVYSRTSGQTKTYRIHRNGGDSHITLDTMSALDPFYIFSSSFGDDDMEFVGSSTASNLSGIYHYNFNDDKVTLLYSDSTQSHFDEIYRADNQLMVTRIEQGIKRLYFGKTSNNKLRLEEYFFPDSLFRLQYCEVDAEKTEFNGVYSSPDQLPIEFNIDLNTKLITWDSIYCPARQNTSAKYEYKYLSAVSRDSLDIPITIIEPTTTLTRNIAHIQVYGAYGAFLESGFEEHQKYLLDNGITVVKIHVRGSRANGWDWYSQGKLFNKKNTSQDYIDAIEHLKRDYFNDSTFVVGYGESAGGLALAMAVNQMPDIVDAAILDHPFVDVLEAMREDDAPLTAQEYGEWGNPHLTTDSLYILSYSPAQNINTKSSILYPPLYIACGQKDRSTPAWQVFSYISALKLSARHEEILVKHHRFGHPGFMPYAERMSQFVDQMLFINSLAKE